MPLQISQSVNALTDHLEQVLKAELPSVLVARETADYPLPMPAADDWYVGGKTAQEVAGLLGDPQVFAAIAYGPSPLTGRSSGGAATESYRRETQIEVSIVLEEDQGATIPSRNGRTLLRCEWMRIRAEMYRGALQDVLPKHGPDGQNIHQIRIVDGGVSDDISVDTSTYRKASVTFAVVQEVDVNVAT